MNILDLIKNEKYYVNIKEPFRRILTEKYESAPTKTAASRMTIHRILYKPNYYTKQNTYFSLTDSLGFSKKDAEFGINSVKTRMSFPIPVTKLEINEHFLRILAHILGDGGIHIIEREDKYRAFYVNNEHILLNSFANDVKLVFGDVYIYFRERINHGDEIWLPTSLGYILYKILDYKINNKKKRVPHFVYDLTDKNLVGAFLQAFFDDEGTISVSKHMIVLSLGSEELLNDIRLLFQKLNIGVNKILKIVPKNRSIMYSFSITSKANILLYAQHVGFLHPMKTQRLKILVNKYNGVS